MALIQCPDCQTEVSDAAASCTKCGRVREPSALGQFAKGLLLVFNAAMAVWFIGEVMGAAEPGDGALGGRLGHPGNARAGVPKATATTRNRAPAGRATK